jgi:hypothetical protein
VVLGADVPGREAERCGGDGEAARGEELVEVAAGEAEPSPAAQGLVAAAGQPLPGGRVEEFGVGCEATPTPVVDRNVMLVDGEGELGDDAKRIGACRRPGEDSDLVLDDEAGHLVGEQGGGRAEGQGAVRQQERDRDGLPQQRGVQGVVGQQPNRPGGPELVGQSSRPPHRRVGAFW